MGKEHFFDTHPFNIVDSEGEPPKDIFKTTILIERIHGKSFISYLFNAVFVGMLFGGVSYAFYYFADDFIWYIISFIAGGMGLVAIFLLLSGAHAHRYNFNRLGKDGEDTKALIKYKIQAAKAYRKGLVRDGVAVGDLTNDYLFLCIEYKTLSGEDKLILSPCTQEEYQLHKLGSYIPIRYIKSEPHLVFFR